MHKVIITGLLLTGITSLFAQDKLLKQRMYSDIEVTNTVTKSYRDSTWSFQVKVVSDHYDPDFSKRYFWFHQGEVKSTVGNYSGKLLHGNFEKFDREGTLLEKGNFRNGLKDGEWISWYRNGTIANHVVWNDGQRTGGFDEYFENGSKRKSGTFKADKLNGKVILYSKDGIVTNEEKYKNGKLIKTEEHKKKDQKNKTKSNRKIKQSSDSTIQVRPRIRQNSDSVQMNNNKGLSLTPDQQPKEKRSKRKNKSADAIDNSPEKK